MTESGGDDLDWVDRSDLLLRDSDVAFVYRVRNIERTVIYVGKTKTEPGNRFAEHAYASSWWGAAFSAEVCKVPYKDVMAVEAAEIHRWHPAGNKRCYVCGSAAKFKPAQVRTGRSRVSGVEINGAVLREARIRMGLTGQALADKIVIEHGNTLSKGVSRDFISKVERGARRVRPSTLIAFAAVLECEPASLRVGQDPG